MVEWKKHDLPTLVEKETEEQKQQEKEALPGRVAAMEDALCEQDAANDKHTSTIEQALCDLDEAINAINANKE